MTGRERLIEAWRLAAHAPLRVKIVLLVAVAYLACPIDLVPDFIPVLGQLDDLLVIGLLAGYLRRAAPELAALLPMKARPLPKPKGRTMARTTVVIDVDERLITEPITDPELMEWEESR
jgi:uncharacterized membrane protein YkvA (DUF1232 family)